MGSSSGSIGSSCAPVGGSTIDWAAAAHRITTAERFVVVMSTSLCLQAAAGA